MNVDSPDAAEGDETGDGFQRKTEEERGKVDQAHCVDRVERMFAVGGEPVEVFGAVVDRVEPPEKPDAMLQPVAPIDQEITQYDDFNGLQPPRLRGDAMAERKGNAVEPAAELYQDQRDEAGPEQ